MTYMIYEHSKGTINNLFWCLKKKTYFGVLGLSYSIFRFCLGDWRRSKRRVLDKKEGARERNRRR